MDSLSSEERGTWELNGDLPDRVAIGTQSPDVPAASSTAPTELRESSPASPAAPAASTDASLAPASEPGPPAERKGAKARNGELDAEIQGLQDRLKLRKALREELASLERPAPHSAAQPAATAAATPTQQDWQRIMAQPDAPKEADFDSFAEFTAAAAYHVTQSVLRDERAAQQEQTVLQREVTEIQTMAASAAERIAVHAQTHPEFADRIDPRLLNLETASVRRLTGEKVGPQHLLAEETLKSPAVVQLLEHFSTPEGQRDWRDLLVKPPSDLLRAFGHLEARFDSASPSAPTPKTVSSAPAPPVTLGSRPADTSDPLEAAIKRKDTAAYVREANKRELAAMGL